MQNIPPPGGPVGGGPLGGPPDAPGAKNDKVIEVKI